MNSLSEEINRLFEEEKLDEIPSIIAQIESSDERFMFELKWYTYQKDFATIIRLFETSTLYPDETDSNIVSSIFFYAANAYRKVDELDLCKDFLKMAIEYNRESADVLWLRREIYGKVSKKNKHFSILLHGFWETNDEGVDVNFYSKYEVVAESLHKALEEIINFEMDDLDKTSFEIEEYEEFETAPDNLSGIYETNIFHLYDAEEEGNGEKTDRN